MMGRLVMWVLMLFKLGHGSMRVLLRGLGWQEIVNGRASVSFLGTYDHLSFLLEENPLPRRPTPTAKEAQQNTLAYHCKLFISPFDFTDHGVDRILLTLTLKAQRLDGNFHPTSLCRWVVTRAYH